MIEQTHMSSTPLSADVQNINLCVKDVIFLTKGENKKRAWGGGIVHGYGSSQHSLYNLTANSECLHAVGVGVWGFAP